MSVAGLSDVKFLTVINSIPVMQLRHNSIVVYHEPLQRRSSLNNKRKWENKYLYKQAYSGKVTQGVRKRLTKAINLMLMTVKPKYIFNDIGNYWQYHKLSFITLKITAARNISVHEAYESCFCYFLDWFTRTATKNPRPLYTWKAELQKDGQVHYHITTPEWINCQALRRKWNEILRKAGFLEDYVKEHGHYNANATDIHQVNDVKNLSAYMIKALTDSIAAAEKIKKTRQGKQEQHIGAEMAKEIQNEESTDGKIWGCSELLQNAKYAVLVLSDRHHDFIKKMEAIGKIKSFYDEGGFWGVHHFTDCSPPDILNKTENSYLTDFLTWQMQRPLKGSNPLDIEAWEKQMPQLN